MAMNGSRRTRMSQKSKRKKGNVYETLDVRCVGGTTTFAVVGVAMIMDTGGANNAFIARD